MSGREFTVAGVGDLKDGEMRQVAAGETQVLLARVAGRYHAVGATCPHYGAPLVDGVLSGSRVVCPWHHACFNVTTGDLEEPPAMDALPCYAVRVEDGRVSVEIPEEAADRRTPPMVNRDSADGRVFVIIGGGAAGYSAAQTLREDGFSGRIRMITREDRAPYDRPNLSKDYLQGRAEPEWMPLRADEFFTEHDIEIARGLEATGVDAAAKTITLGDGTSEHYDALLVATGGAARELNVAGAEMSNVFLLRSFDDADAITEEAGRSHRAVVIGASFIGMEATYSLTERGLSVTVVMRASDGLYAAGDIARFPDPRTGRRARIEHWRTAEQQGRVAAHNMAGKAVEYDSVPFFWTRQFDAGLLYVGHAGRWDEIIYQGDLSAQDFCAFYVADGRVLAVAGMNRDRDMAAVEELMRLGRMPAPAEIKSGAADFLELLRAAQG